MPHCACAIGAIAMFTLAVEDGERPVRRALSIRIGWSRAPRVPIDHAPRRARGHRRRSSLAQAIYYALYFLHAPQLAVLRFPNPVVFFPLFMGLLFAGLWRTGLDGRALRAGDRRLDRRDGRRADRPPPGDGRPRSLGSLRPRSPGDPRARAPGDVDGGPRLGRDRSRRRPPARDGADHHDAPGLHAVVLRAARRQRSSRRGRRGWRSPPPSASSTCCCSGAGAISTRASSRSSAACCS